MASLFELTQEFDALFLELLNDDNDGQITPEQAARIDQMGESITVKIDNCMCMAREFEHRAAAAKEEAARLTKRSQSHEKKALALKLNIQNSMHRLGLSVNEGQRFRIRLGTTPGHVVVTQKDLIPGVYWTPQDPKLNKKAVSDVIKSGGEVPGCKIEKNPTLYVT